MDSCPRHVAIIMDGNGRWAKKQNKPRTAGHFKGTENVRNIAIAAKECGVEVLTLYAFSTENWIRPKDEVDYLMKLPAYFFERFLKELMANQIRVASIGEMDAFPVDTRRVLEAAIQKTAGNTGMVLNFAMNYGSRRELTLACRSVCEKVMAGELGVDAIDERVMGQALMTSSYPDVDFMIRTSGECRLSNFLLWQLAYAELYFTDVAWPDFTVEDFHLALEAYGHRQRRYGGL